MPTNEERDEGRAMSPEEIEEWLRVRYRCDTCGRAGFSETTHGSICHMTQPDGSRCDGIFRRPAPEDA